jgi:predicted nucleotidyltransferase
MSFRISHQDLMRFWQTWNRQRDGRRLKYSKTSDIIAAGEYAQVKNREDSEINVHEIAAKALADAGDIVFAYLFGSAANGGFGARSDVDVDLIVLNSCRSIPLRRAIVSSGIPLVDRDPDRRSAYEVSIQHDSMDFMYSMEQMNA